jgi:hypothetical protein
VVVADADIDDDVIDDGSVVEVDGDSVDVDVDVVGLSNDNVDVVMLSTRVAVMADDDVVHERS